MYRPSVTLTAQKNQLGYNVNWSGTGFSVGEVVYAKLVGFTAQGPLAVGILTAADASGNFSGATEFNCRVLSPSPNVVVQIFDAKSNEVIATSNPLAFDRSP